MTANRMALDHIQERGVAAHTEFVDWFIKLKAVFGGMGAVAGNTTAALNNAVDIVGRAIFSEQVFLVDMAGNTDIILALCPKLP